jgi:proteasome assembly chaperone (PAC2) family protein
VQIPCKYLIILLVPPKRPRKTDYEYLLGLKTREIIGRTLNTLIKSGAVVGVAGFVYLMVRELAGKETLASIGLGFLADIKTSRGIAMALVSILGVGGPVYGLRERKLRRDDIEKRSAYIEELEKAIDKRRTSSGLTPRGTTRKEDRQ